LLVARIHPVSDLPINTLFKVSEVEYLSALLGFQDVLQRFIVIARSGKVRELIDIVLSIADAF
jgi:hypothetical protein